MTKQVIIDRSKWRTGSCGLKGTGNGPTRLKNDEGFMCCLGFITKSYKKKVCGLEVPAQAECHIPHLTTKNGKNYEDTELSQRAMMINDNIYTTRQAKEKSLKKLFKDVLDLKFVGRSVKSSTSNY